MGTWILVMYIYAGTFAKGDSVAIQTIEGYSSKTTCQQAATEGKKLVENSSKEYRYICVQRN